MSLLTARMGGALASAPAATPAPTGKSSPVRSVDSPIPVAEPFHMTAGRYAGVAGGITGGAILGAGAGSIIAGIGCLS
ncbi:MAG: hypothetical protein H7123_06140 [Thermoleophilia bacterium]|nr:hypothetical protein [Thermoleophilia bacterium]